VSWVGGKHGRGVSSLYPASVAGEMCFASRSQVARLVAATVCGKLCGSPAPYSGVHTGSMILISAYKDSTDDQQ
jgi:hypothetical protein